MRNSVWKKMALLAFIWVFAAASCLSAYAGDFKLGYNTKPAAMITYSPQRHQREILVNP